ncbi:MAG: hypothetical protein LBB26_04170 [Puniceicoccales bacterium]|jgi:hypothetical protein|nr:hypothetical protein [Puniceicoccales bacterium]
MIPAVIYPLLIPSLWRVVPFAGRWWLVGLFAFSCAACELASSRWIFIGMAFLSGVFLAISAGVERRYDQMVARIFALVLQGLAACFLAKDHFTSLAEKMLFLGQVGIAGVFPFCFSGSEYSSGPVEILPYALCVLLNPFVKFSPILPALSVAFHTIGAVNEQYVWKFLHRLFAATVCLLISFGGAFHGYKGLFIFSFYQLLFLYLHLGTHLPGGEYLTMAEVKGMAHRRPWAALEFALGVLILSGGPLSTFFPLLCATACLFLFVGHGAIAVGICMLLCAGTALAVRWIIQLSLCSKVECLSPEKPIARWFSCLLCLLWTTPWVAGLQKSYRYFFGF